MTITSKQRYELKRFIKELEAFKGRHTELVTVYIPSGYDINKITTHIAQEQGTAQNIKSAATRKNVIDALEKMLQHLKLFPQTPPNGLAVFSGNVSGEEGRYNFQVYSIEPPVPLRTRIYRCDKTFLLDSLREMLDDKECYGLVVMDRRDADIAMLKGKAIVPLSAAKSNVPGKTRAGGQSAARYGRLREDAAREFYKKIGDMMKEQFLGKEGLKGIIVGGPGPTKYEFVEGNFIPGEIKSRIIAVKDISYTGDFGLQELLEKSSDTLAQEEVMEEKALMGRFFDLLSKKPGMVSYGASEVKKQVGMGVVDIVLVSESAGDTVIEELEELSKPVSTEVRMVSTETREGVQLRDMGGVAAILRFDTGTA